MFPVESWYKAKGTCLGQTLIDDNWYLVFVKVELIPHKRYQVNPLKSRNVPQRNQRSAPYLGIPLKTSGSVQSPAALWLN